MDEWIDIWDETGCSTGKIALKSEAHRQGWFHPTVHVWFYTRSGLLVFQKRSHHKDTFPGFWDVSVAGHLASGETPIAGALREIKEEIGLEVFAEQLKSLGLHKSRHKHHALIDCEFHHLFVCELPCSLEELRPQESEVDALILAPISTLEEGKLSPTPDHKLVPHGLDYFQKIKNGLSFLL